MRAVVLTSMSLRHQYFLKIIDDNFDLAGAVCEDKGSYYAKQKKESKLVKTHFDKLRATEKLFFNEELKSFDIDTINLKKINKNEINNHDIIKWVKELNPDTIFLFGTGILNDGWLDGFKNIINLHLGLSPFYRGSATLFWPFANDELECLGVTIHIAAKKVDAGDIIARVKPEFREEDNYYTINYKTIKQAINRMPKVVREFLSGEINTIKQDISYSKTYKKSDFNEDVLKEVLDKYGKTLSEKILLKTKESSKCSCCQ